MGGYRSLLVEKGMGQTVARRDAQSRDAAGGHFQHMFCARPGTCAPRGDVGDAAQDHAVGVEIENVDGLPHEGGMDAGATGQKQGAHWFQRA